MLPREYISQLPLNGRKEFALKMGFSKSMVTHIGNGHVAVPVSKAVLFAESSDGLVSQEDVIASILDWKKEKSRS